MTRDQLLRSAEKHIAKGKFEPALKDYLRVVDENPRDISTLNKIGDLYVRMNRGFDSIPFFTRIAEVCSLDGFFLKAIAIYKKINKIDPSRLDVYERLGDLYTRQGLTQDSRTQYQILADHYQKNNLPRSHRRHKKMAAVDPNDLKIRSGWPTSTGASTEARGRRDAVRPRRSDAAAPGSAGRGRGGFKSARASPQDAAARNTLVRSLLSQNPGAALAILKAAPRTADSLALMAEAQFEIGQKAEAVRTAEQVVALEEEHLGARLALCRSHLAEANFEAALADVSPLVDAATAAGDFTRAASYLATILQIEEAHRDSLQKMAEVREAEGNGAESARLRLALAREDERRGNVEAAIDNYRRAVKAVPGLPEAETRLLELSRGAALSPAPPGAPPEMVVDLEDAASERGPRPRPVPAPPGGRESSEERALEALIVEAEIFARYGLSDKAIERLRTVVRQRPELPGARERLLELMAATRNPALAQETESFVDFCRQRDELPRAEALLSKLGLAPTPATAPPPAPSETFEEFPVEPRPATAEFIEDFESDSIPFEAEGPAVHPSARAEATVPPPPAGGASAAAAPASYEGLNSLLREEMQKAAGPPSSAPAPSPAVDEQSLFADEQQFFNLAEELEKDLAEQASIPTAPAMAGPEGEVSLEEIFREFKKGVEQQLSPEDYETHSNLGIAYKEMGLIDEAIGEFQLASKDPGRAVECCSMLGLCFLEKGMPQLAIKWYRKGLETPRITETETVGLLYDLAMVYQSTGDLDNAYQTFLEVYGFDTGFRDVAARVRELETVRKV